MQHIKEVIPTLLQDLYKRQCRLKGKEASVQEFERLTANYHRYKRQRLRINNIKNEKRLPSSSSQFINRITD